MSREYAMTMSERIANRIIDLIAINEIKLCSRLVEQDLMNRFDVSQTVIREAKLLLESKGLVTTYPRRGTYVNNPSNEEISMLYNIRKNMDISAVRAAAVNCTQKDIDELESLCKDAEKAYLEKDYLGFFRISRQFHVLIYEISGFSCAAKIYDDLITITDIFHFNHHKSRDIDLQDDVNGHAMICRAIASRDPQACEELISQHIEKTFERDLKIAHSPSLQ